MLEKRLKVVEGQGVLGMNVNDLGLVAEVGVPPKFKVPILDKYNGTTCPKTHVKAYYYKMSMYSKDESCKVWTQGPNEYFKEYAHKWHELAARVQPPMMERELVDMFMGTLQGPYYDRMVGSTSVGFSELVMSGERIEVGLKMSKIQSTNAGSSTGRSAKKPFGGYPKKKEGESSAMYSQRGQERTQQ
ncbi:uncharacterized protein LOC127101400 [Lathyrus oleraceus]|uniref:uncharacterized protein LOC127101400 n=1 Tax=Pisum sativum TaxID=3888 RepID=UPI0021D32B1D|nr:uncharacterized protein LOC127101400 [Pisum sativum]